LVYKTYFNKKLIFIIMYKTTLLFFAAGMAVGACIGLIISNLAIGMGLGAALGLIFTRRYRRSQ
jgi:H+/Cl- antiporter ClcA